MSRAESSSSSGKNSCSAARVLLFRAAAGAHGVNLLPPFTPAVPTQVRERFQANHNLRLVSGGRAPSVRRAEDSPSCPVASRAKRRHRTLEGRRRTEFRTGKSSPLGTEAGKQSSPGEVGGDVGVTLLTSAAIPVCGEGRGKRRSAKTNRRTRTR